MGIVGGILCILCASGVFAMYWFVLQPANNTYNIGQTQLGLYTMETQLNQTIVGINWSAPFYPPLINDPTGKIILIDSYMKMAPVSSVNFWGVIQLDMFICFIVLAAMGAIGGILAITGAGED